MLTHMAQRISSFFISKDIVPEEERSIYDYSFEILLSTVMNFLAVMIIAFFSHTVIPTIWFLIGFMAIRATAGGFHAETHVGCFLILMCTYGGYLLGLLWLSNSVLTVLTVVFSIISWLLVVILAPVEDHNKTFSKDEYRKFKKTSNIAVSVVLAISFVFVLFFEKVTWGYSIAAGMHIVSLSLIAGTVKNKVRKRRKNKRKGEE